MSDLFYRIVRSLGRPVFGVTSRPVVKGLDHVPARGAFILATTHQSPYDVALLIRHTPRLLDFVSITEVFRNPLVGWFYGSMNAFPLERSSPDAPTVRIILDRLSRGRGVAMFPEGRICRVEESAVVTGRIRPGLGRLAKIAGAPVVPCVILDSEAYSKPSNWLPIRKVRYGVVYGRPLPPREDVVELEVAYVREIVRLHAILRSAMQDASGPGAGAARPEGRG